MAVYQVYYDKLKESDYEPLKKRLKQYNGWFRTGNTWIIKTHQNATQVRDHLMAAIDPDGPILLVTELTGHAAWGGIDDKYNKSIKNLLNS